MDNSTEKKAINEGWGISIGFMIFVILISRFPFLSNGYGTEVDSWRVANAARIISSTHEYNASRFPGHPVQELICSLFWMLGPIGLNGLSTLLMITGAITFGLILKTLGFKSWLMGATAMTFIPVLFLSSVSSKDYCWGLAFILLSTYFVLLRRNLAAGIMLGLATGCRITSILTLPVLILMLWSRCSAKQRIRETLILAGSALVLSLAEYYLVYHKYGIGYFTVVEKRTPTLLDSTVTGLIDVWGVLGAFALLLTIVAIPFTLLRLERGKITYPGSQKMDPFAWLLQIIIYTATFIRLPYHAGYLVPVIPFILLLTYKYSSKAVSTFLILCLVLSPYILGLSRSDKVPKGTGGRIPLPLAGENYAFFPAAGSAILDYYGRLELIGYVKKSIEIAGRLPRKSVIVTGSYEPVIRNILPSMKINNAEFVYWLSEEDLNKYLQDNYKLLYLQGAPNLEKYTFHIDLRDYGAVLLQD